MHNVMMRPGSVPNAATANASADAVTTERTAVLAATTGLVTEEPRLGEVDDVLDDVFVQGSASPAATADPGMRTCTMLLAMLAAHAATTQVMSTAVCE